ncbi:MAG: helix-turn-helix domain-containing protein [Patescibacteria group bacterium]
MDKIYDEKGNRRLLQNLEKIGLSEKESRIYLYLIGREVEVGSSKIVAATKLHGQYVYTALGSLEGKGLVKHVIKNGRKKWSANPPARLDSLIEEKRMVANEARDTLERMFTHQREQEFEVYQGNDQFVTNEFQMIEEAEQDSFIDIIGGEGSRFRELLGEERGLYNEKSLAKNIMVRFIGTIDQKNYLEETKKKRQNFDFRIMPGFNRSSVSTSIYPKHIQFQIYGDPVLVFKIKSEQIARDYRTFFESLWNLCSDTM